MKFTPAACCGRGECVENGTAGALFDRHVRYSTAVSYTHLDVYKRQDRLRHMNEKNPLLAELRRELDLEVE